MSLQDLFSLNVSLLCVGLCFVLGLGICRLRSLHFRSVRSLCPLRAPSTC